MAGYAPPDDPDARKRRQKRSQSSFSRFNLRNPMTKGRPACSLIQP